MFRLFATRYYSTSATVFETMQNTLRNDLKVAMRNKAPQAERTMYRSIMSELKNLDIDCGPETTPDEFKIWDHLNKLSKQRRETAAEYLKPGQPERFQELAEKEIIEAKLIESYLTKLPVASKDEITIKVKEIIQKEGISLEDKKQLFKSIPWGKIQNEWKASRGMVSDAINELK
ncbi:Aim41 protein [Martiniozyma asiatica (nom. inval.)]|nr:Aim41 protein [Martiniozyma asiatica]